MKLETVTCSLHFERDEDFVVLSFSIILKITENEATKFSSQILHSGNTDKFAFFFSEQGCAVVKAFYNRFMVYCLHLIVFFLFCVGLS